MTVISTVRQGNATHSTYDVPEGNLPGFRRMVREDRGVIVQSSPVVGGYVIRVQYGNVR